MQQLMWSQALLVRPSVSRASRDAVMIGVMDYKMLDRQRTSSNLGDYVQTLAMMANLCRFSQADFADGSELGQFASGLQKRVETSRKIAGPKTKVQLVPVDRDFSSGRKYPSPVWMIANGWYMHRNFRGDFDFPFHKDIKPIFISFHLNQLGIMNSEIAAYLKSCGPIGCRDWTTVYGCGTTVFPRSSRAASQQLSVRYFPVIPTPEGPPPLSMQSPPMPTRQTPAWRSFRKWEMQSVTWIWLRACGALLSCWKNTTALAKS